jgi:hypothetical protein
MRGDRKLETEGNGQQRDKGNIFLGGWVAWWKKLVGKRVDAS